MTTLQSSSIGVIGAGAWGTALAVSFARNGRQTALWGRNHQDLVDLAARSENARYLPGVRLLALPHVTRDLSSVMSSGVIVLAVPAQEIRTLAPLMALRARANQPVVICAKGIERGTGKMMTEVVSEFMPDVIPAVLSGPTFAREVAQGLPTAVTLACRDMDMATLLAGLFSGNVLRAYATSDVTGVELCGAVKNVLAIACGIAAGRNLGENARAALITRGMAELRRLVVAMGGQADTLLGLAGVGDITLTCSSPQSRNFSLGLMLGQGQTIDEIEANPHKLAEGRFTASAVLQRAQEVSVDLPICAAVDAVLNQGAAIDTTIASILARPLKPEHL